MLALFFRANTREPTLHHRSAAYMSSHSSCLILVLSLLLLPKSSTKFHESAKLGSSLSFAVLHPAFPFNDDRVRDIVHLLLDLLWFISDSFVDNSLLPEWQSLADASTQAIRQGFL